MLRSDSGNQVYILQPQTASACAEQSAIVGVGENGDRNKRRRVMASLSCMGVPEIGARYSVVLD